MFYEFSSSFFLYYSLLEIQRFYFLFLIRKISYLKLKPIPIFWFNKVSFLLRSGSYEYTSFSNFRYISCNSTFNSLLSIKNKVIENSLFNIIFPIFQNRYLFKALFSREYFVD